ncbi:MAG: 4Fe-4S dicluster domain-containing protein [Phycisphaerae bacterium]
MAGKIVIDTQRCKGCGLCVAVCPKKSIVISEESNKSGYFPAKFECNNCTGCAACAIVCPEAIIEVFAEERIIAVEQREKTKHTLSKAKT